MIVFQFTVRSERVKVLEEYLISFLGLENSLKFSISCTTYHFSDKLNGFAAENCLLTTLKILK